MFECRNPMEKRLMELKAALYFRGNVSKLVRAAISAFKGEIEQAKCLRCQVPMKPAETTLQHRGAEATEVPARRCPTCGRLTIDSRVAVVVENILADRRSGESISISQLLDMPLE